MFRVGDRVWTIDNGWGVVKRIHKKSLYPIVAKFEKSTIGYTVDGKETVYRNRALFFEEIQIPESALYKKTWRAEREKCYYFIESTGKVERERELGCGVDDDRYNIGNYFKTKEDAMESDIYKAFHKEVK